MLGERLTVNSREKARDGVDSNSDEALALIEKQADLYRRLKRLASRQRDLVRNEDPSQLLGLLAERRTLTDELARAAGHMANVRAKWEVVAAELSQVQRDRTERLLAEIRSAAREIIASDSEDMGLLEVRKHRVGEELGRLPARGAMLTAYGAKPDAARLDRMDQQS